MRQFGVAVAVVAAGLGWSSAASAAGPAISGISANSGSYQGGYQVTISGSGLAGATSVTFGGIAAQIGSIAVDGTSMVVTVPATTNLPTPTVTGATTPSLTPSSPAHGPISGGNNVVITGTGFLDPVNVVVTAGGQDSGSTGNNAFTYNGYVGASIGGTSVTSITVDNATQLHVTAPPGVAGVANIIVVTPYADSGATGYKLYTYTEGSPNIGTIGPQSGLTEGGYNMVITGSNFIPGTYSDGTPATTVTIGGVSATNVSVVNTTTISLTVPAGSAGAQPVLVTNILGNGGGKNFLYVAPQNPVVTSVSPNGGSIANGGTTAGGIQVKIFGAHFIGTSQVTFGGVAVSGFNVVSDGEIDTTTPTHPAGGAVDVVVTVTPVGSSTSYTGTGTGVFTYVIPPPVVSAIGPNTGNTTGGTNVTITGQYFTGVTGVSFGGVAATSFTFKTDNSISAVAPPGTGTVDVVVTTPYGTSTAVPADQFTYALPVSTITSISPASGPVSGGTTVTITGTNLSGATAVSFGGTAADPTTITNNTSTSLTITTPPRSQSGGVAVTVTTGAGAGNSGTFTYTALPPTVTGISPTSGTTQGGTPVTITGTGFSGTPLVAINGVAAGNVIVIGPTTLTAITPAGTGTNDPVIVTTSAGPSSAVNLFSYIAPANAPAPPAPTITGITANNVSPASGPVTGGTAITITGTNLSGATAVQVDGIAATSVAVINDTTVTAVTPPDSAGTKSVYIATPGGTNQVAGQFSYLALPPTVTGVSASSGTSLGGTSVTITGTNFTGATSVTFGGTPAASFSVINATTITAKTPAHSAMTVDVAVTTSTSPLLTGTGSSLYTYIAASPPTVTSLSVSHGDIAGGTSITITGTNFTGATSITIGGTAVQFPIVVNSTTITATTPAHVVGAFDTVVTTPAGTSVTSNADVFTFTAKPTVTGISPNTGPAAGGTVVTITGTNFTPTTTVAFGSTPGTSVVVNGMTSITVTSPAGTGVQNVTVTTVGGTSAVSTPDQFTYSSPPTVTLLTPSSGPVAGGTSVNITGTNFLGATSVKFGTTSASFSINSSTSISAVAPAGSGAVDVKVTTAGGTSATTSADTFTYAKAVTSLTLTSSPNPSVVGQPVTFTAKITGNSPTGQVTFSYNNTVLGTATLVSGIATLKVASLPVGSDLVSASYPGDANNAADPESLIQVVQANSDSTMLRQMQLTVMPIVANLSGQAISGAIDSALGVGFGNDPQLLTPNGSGFTYYFYGGTQQQVSEQTGEKLNSSAQALMSPSTGGNSKIDDDFKALGYADTPGFASAPPAARTGQQPTQLPRDWLVWIDVRGAGFGHTGSANDLNGTQVNVLAGVTRRVTPDFVVGALGGYEHFDFSSQAYNGVLRGSGFTLGSYAGLRLGPVRIDGAMAWSDITAADTAGTATGNFGGSRWLATGGVTGNFTWAGLGFEPSTRFYALWETENAYTDSLGTQQARRDFNTGRGSAGIKVSYPFLTGAGTLSPYLGIYGDYYMSKDDAPNPGLTSVLLLQGGAVRATGGLTAAFASGPQLSVGGEYSRTGTDMHIWTMRVRGNVPF